MRGHRNDALLRAVRAVILAAAPVAALASEGSLPELPMVTVVGKVEQPLSETASTVSLIDAGQIAAMLANDARELFRFEPGLSVGGDPNRFGLGAVSIRGLGGNRVLVQTDGVPAPAGFAVGSYSDTGRPLTDLGFVERVEVLRGPASSLYGSDALAGVIAISTVRPHDLIGTGAGLATTARGGWSSVDGGWYSSVLGTGRWGATSVLLGYGARRGEAADIAADVEPNPTSTGRDTAHLRLEHDTTAGPLGLTATFDSMRRVTDVDSLELSGGRFANTVLLRGDDRNESLRVVLDQSLDSPFGLDRGNWRVYWQRGEVDQFTDEERRRSSRAAPLAIERRFLYQDTIAGGELALAHTIAADHRLVGGIELSRSRVEELRDGLQTDLDTGESTNVLLGETMPVRDFPISEVSKAGLFLQDDWRPGQGPIGIIAALRADWYRLDPRPDDTYREDNPAQVPVELDTFSVSPRLGLTWRIGETATGFVQYAHGFRAPPFEDANIGLDLPQFNVRAIPNPDLKPERSDSVELGLRLEDHAVSGSLSAWFGRYLDFIQTKVNLGPDPETGVILFQSQNLDRAEIWGVEAALSFALGAASARLDDWTLDFSAAYAHGDDAVRNVPLDSIEPTRAVLGLRYDAPGRRVRLGLFATAVAAKRRVDPTTPDPLRLDGFFTLDATAGWTLSENWRVDAGVFNLTDASYLEWADVRGRPAGDPLLDYYRRPGRNWRLTVTASW